MDRFEMLALHEGRETHLWNICKLVTVSSFFPEEQRLPWIQKQIDREMSSDYTTPITRLLSEARVAWEQAEINRTKWRDMKDKIIKATVEHDGCAGGKLDFLESLGITTDDLPTVNITVTSVYHTSAPKISDDESIQKDFISDFFTDGLDLNDGDVVQVEVGY